MAEKLNFTEKVPISSHLIELKNRMIKVTIVLAFFFGLCFYFKEFLLFWLEDPLPAKYRGNLIFIETTEPFFAHMKVSFMGALFISMPYILYHIWFFISPGLKVKEKKITMLFVLFGTLFFLFGGVFCYFLVLPLGLKFLINYGIDYYTMQVTIKFYFSFCGENDSGLRVCLPDSVDYGIADQVRNYQYHQNAVVSQMGLPGIVSPVGSANSARYHHSGAFGHSLVPALRVRCFGVCLF